MVGERDTRLRILVAPRRACWASAAKLATRGTPRAGVPLSRSLPLDQAEPDARDLDMRTGWLAGPLYKTNLPLWKHGCRPMTS
jgi:hypothetical protein